MRAEGSPAAPLNEPELVMPSVLGGPGKHTRLSQETSPEPSAHISLGILKRVLTCLRMPHCSDGLMCRRGPVHSQVSERTRSLRTPVEVK